MVDVGALIYTMGVSIVDAGGIMVFFTIQAIIDHRKRRKIEPTGSRPNRLVEKAIEMRNR